MAEKRNFHHPIRRGGGQIFLVNLILMKVRSSGKMFLQLFHRYNSTIAGYGGTALSLTKLILSVSLQEETVWSICKNGLLEKVLKRYVSDGMSVL